MKTKIVYVLCSSEEDIYLEQLLLSLYSLRIHNASAFVELVVDKRTDATLKGKRELVLGYIDKKIVLDVSDEYNKVERSRWMKTSLRKYVAGDYLFLDTDTIIADRLDEVDDFIGDIGAVLNCHIPIGQHAAKKKMEKWSKRDGWTFTDDLMYYNSGVMFVKDNQVTEDFYDVWHERWKTGVKKYRHMADQTYLAAANEEKGYVISEMDGTWNCQLVKNGLRYYYGAKILHYLDWGLFSKTKPWIFYDESIFGEIKSEGRLTEKAAMAVKAAKQSFPSKIQIVAGRDLNIVQSPTFTFLTNNQWLMRLLNPITFVLMGIPKAYKRINARK